MADIKILKPCKTAMSSGLAKTKKWVIKFDESSEKYQEDLMGWMGTQDNRYQMKLQFDTKEEAIAFAQAHGLSFEIEDPPMRLLKPKSYGSHFSAHRMKG